VRADAALAARFINAGMKEALGASSSRGIRQTGGSLAQAILDFALDHSH
jgi:hypothetical protein